MSSFESSLRDYSCQALIVIDNEVAQCVKQDKLYSLSNKDEQASIYICHVKAELSYLHMADFQISKATINMKFGR